MSTSTKSTHQSVDVLTITGSEEGTMEASTKNTQQLLSRLQTLIDNPPAVSKTSLPTENHHKHNNFTNDPPTQQTISNSLNLRTKSSASQHKKANSKVGGRINLGPPALVLQYLTSIAVDPCRSIAHVYAASVKGEAESDEKRLFILSDWLGYEEDNVFCMAERVKLFNDVKEVELESYDLLAMFDCTDVDEQNLFDQLLNSIAYGDNLSREQFTRLFPSLYTKFLLNGGGRPQNVLMSSQGSTAAERHSPVRSHFNAPTDIAPVPLFSLTNEDDILQLDAQGRNKTRNGQKNGGSDESRVLKVTYTPDVYDIDVVVEENQNNHQSPIRRYIRSKKSSESNTKVGKPPTQTKEELQEQIRKQQEAAAKQLQALDEMNAQMTAQIRRLDRLKVDEFYDYDTKRNSIIRDIQQMKAAAAVDPGKFEAYRKELEDFIKMRQEQLETNDGLDHKKDASYMKATINADRFLTTTRAQDKAAAAEREMQTRKEVEAQDSGRHNIFANMFGTLSGKNTIPSAPIRKKQTSSHNHPNFAFGEYSSPSLKPPDNDDDVDPLALPDSPIPPRERDGVAVYRLHHENAVYHTDPMSSTTTPAQSTRRTTAEELHHILGAGELSRDVAAVNAETNARMNAIYENRLQNILDMKLPEERKKMQGHSRNSAVAPEFGGAITSVSAKDLLAD